MQDAVRRACEVATELLEEFAPVQIHCERYVEKEPHPGGQEAFTLRSQLPWHRSPKTPVLIEITRDEPVLCPVEHRSILHEYGEDLDASVQAYAIDEIVAEKLRALLQHLERLKARGWGRSRARDYYDLWRVLGTYSDQSKYPVEGICWCDPVWRT